MVDLSFNTFHRLKIASESSVFKSVIFEKCSEHQKNDQKNKIKVAS